ncbi:polyisoprenoid-binding protein [Helicobacter sp. 12S02634-8]|uniref:YceI family protein n=1 Tax=Helicobacter sp. 12S02634-8 TaxID=1476199 RepID=UPI000BA73FCD|nr:YceI family protein [Helicobacter sp. 12S02634-8]PAF46435.1 polyisoprenoid-binding protein [Helicobacter sp. 12S02634-8]
MKKTIVGILTLALLGLLANASTLDTTKATTTWTAYKTEAKTPVGGTFDDIKYKFGKKTDSIAGLLEGASATIDPLKVNLGDSVKNKNVKDFFFSHFKKGGIKVTFKNVIEGKDQGTILAVVRMNEKSVKVPMQYTIADGKFTATGVIDILEFALNDAFKKLAVGCHDLHEGLTWSQVAISFSAPIK